MCRAKWENGGRRCRFRETWHVNRESHATFVGDLDEERHWHRPAHLLSMTMGASRMRRKRARDYAAEVHAMRTVNGVTPGAPIGPVLREELWSHRHRGAGLSLLAQAAIFAAVAEEQGVPVERIAERYAAQQITPHRQAAGERLADLVVDPTRPDWVHEEHLVRPIEPSENGTPNPVYLRIVRDLDGTEFALVSSYDGSEPMAYPADAAGLKAAGWEAIQRARAVEADRTAYEAWLADGDMVTSDASPWTQRMANADFLAQTTDGGMHLV